MPKIVLDTNILVSALLANGPPAAIVDMVAEGKLIPIYNDLIVGEYWDVLWRPKFGFSSTQINRLIDAIIRIGVAAKTGLTGKNPMKDEDDRIFYDTAKSSSAFLITGNIKHYPQEPFIVTPVDFLKTFVKGSH